AGERFLGSVRPVYLNRIDVRRLSQAEESQRRAAGQKTLRGVDQAQQAALAAAYMHLGAVGVALPLWIEGTDLQPVSALGSHVSKEPGAVADGRHEQIRSTVAVEIVEGQAAGHIPATAKRRVG